MNIKQYLKRRNDLKRMLLSYLIWTIVEARTAATARIETGRIIMQILFSSSATWSNTLTISSTLFFKFLWEIPTYNKLGYIFNHHRCNKIYLNAICALVLSLKNCNRLWIWCGLVMKDVDGSWEKIILSLAERELSAVWVPSETSVLVKNHILMIRQNRLMWWWWRSCTVWIST